MTLRSKDGRKSRIECMKGRNGDDKPKRLTERTVCENNSNNKSKGTSKIQNKHADDKEAEEKQNLPLQ